MWGQVVREVVEVELQGKPVETEIEQYRTVTYIPWNISRTFSLIPAERCMNRSLLTLQIKDFF